MPFMPAAQVDAFVARGVSEGMISEIDRDGSGSVDRSEFLQHMLVHLGKVEQDDIDKVRFDMPPRPPPRHPPTHATRGPPPL